jgi:NADPH:quinone reductase-like Zn-dependent oxidoreductase
MKAVVYENYGGPEVLRLTEIEKPIPKDGEVSVKIHATTVTVGDTRMRAFNVPRRHWIFARFYLGLFKPKRQVLGMEIAGEIEEVGKYVKRFKTGDRVYASTMYNGFGGYAAYKCLPENGAIAQMPAGVSYSEAAAIPIGGSAALRFLRKGKISAGQKVLIYGATGSVGTFAIQIAHYFGAEVTAVCSTSGIELAESLGASHVIDYTRKDFTSGGKVYDLIFDAVGKINRSKSKRALKQGGVFVSVTGNPGKTTTNDLLFLNQIIQEGKLKSVIEKEFSFDQIVDAHRFVESGRKKGNIAVRVSSQRL